MKIIAILAIVIDTLIIVMMAIIFICLLIVNTPLRLK